MKMESLCLYLLLMSSLLFPMNKSWFLMWMVMEINMASMAMMLMKEKTKEKTILFYLFQSFPSIAILMALMMSALNNQEALNSPMESVILLAMASKMGLFPTHKWILKISKSVSWSNNMILMSVQKLIPLIVLKKTLTAMNLYILATFSLMAMSILLLSSTNTKMFLMTSSMVHMSWMMLSISKLSVFPFFYLLIYSIILLHIVKFFMKKKMITVSSQENKKNKNFLSMKINLISLAGMPPLTGFALKAMVLHWLVKYSSPMMMVMIMLMGATGAFYAYSQLMLKVLLNKTSQKTEKSFLWEKTSKKSMMWNILLPCLIFSK